MEEEKHKLTSKEIRSFYYEQQGSMRKCVSLSRKGKPHKQPSGMHLIGNVPYHKKNDGATKNY